MAGRPCDFTSMWDIHAPMARSLSEHNDHGFEGIGVALRSDTGDGMEVDGSAGGRTIVDGLEAM